MGGETTSTSTIEMQNTKPVTFNGATRQKNVLSYFSDRFVFISNIVRKSQSLFNIFEGMYCVNIA